MAESIELTPENVLRAYAAGIFPMAVPGCGIEWFSPDPRCVFEFERFHVPRSLRQVIRRGEYELRVDSAFERVVRECGADREEGTWISEEIIGVYVELHRMGFAHSVEAWSGRGGGEGELAGGLYGVALGGAFFGESMFHRRANASKVALAGLMERLRGRGYVLVDAQWSTPHLEMFGAVEIAREEYLRRLKSAIRKECRFVDGGEKSELPIASRGPEESAFRKPRG